MRPRAAAQSVEVRRREWAVERVPDLTARHALAVADDPPEVAVRLDQLAALVRPLAALADVRHGELRRRSRPGLEPQPGRAELVTHVLGDRHGGGEAGGADAAHAGVALGRMHAELVVHMLGRGAQAGVHRGHLVLQQPRHDPGALGPQVREPLGGGLRVVLALHVLAVGPSITLPNTVGAISTPFVILVGTGEHDVPHQRARELVEHDQLAAPRRDGEAVVAEHAVQLVGAQARPRSPGSECSTAPAGVARRKPPDVESLDAGHAGSKAQLACR